MAAISTQASTSAGVTPSPITPAASDTIAASQFGPNGVELRVTATSTATTVTVQDPNRTAMGNLGTAAGVAVGTSSTRRIFVPVAAVDPVSNVATVAFSATTGVTYEAFRV